MKREIKPAPNALYPFNDDEIRADPVRYREFLLNGKPGQEQRQQERARQAHKRARR